MTDHTPTPWRCGYMELHDASNNSIAKFIDPRDAAFAGRAVNAHDALVAALTTFMGVTVIGKLPTADDHGKGLAALALARGEP